MSINATNKIGQIVYNLEDFGGTGGLISTKEGSTGNDIICSIISGDINEEYEKNKINIFKPLLKNKNIYKLGIQGPTGTKFLLNVVEDGDNYIGGQEIMLGRTGIYEIDDDVNINNLVFIRPKRWKLDEELSQNSVSSGINEMLTAKVTFLNKINELEPLELVSQTNETQIKNYWETFDTIHEEYLENYNTGRKNFVKGINGIYKEDKSEEDLYNIIIDYIYGDQMTGEED